MSDNLKLACEKFGTPVGDPTLWEDWFRGNGIQGVEKSIYKFLVSPWASEKNTRCWERGSSTTYSRTSRV